MIGRHGGGEAAVLGLAVDLAHVDTERHVPLDQVRRDRRGAGGGAPGAVQPHRALDVVEHEEVGDPKQQAEAQGGPPARDAVLGDSRADRKRPVVGESARTGRVAHPERDRRVELLPDARHREEHRRRHLADVVGHGVEALREVHGGARAQRVEHAERALGHVAERQERELLIALAQLGDVVGVVDLEQDVAVAQHRALGRPGRARGVDQDRQIVRSGELDHPLERAGVLRLVADADLQEVLEGHHLLVLEGVQPLGIEDDDLHELGTAGAYREDLVELLLVRGEEEARAAVVHDVLDLLGGVGRVDPVRDGADRERPEVRVEPFRAVVGHDRDHVAGAQAERDQAQADVLRPLAVLAPADRAPDAEVLLAHGHAVSPLADDVAEQLRQGVLAEDGGRGLGHHRHVFFLFQRRVPRTPDSFMPR